MKILKEISILLITLVISYFLSFYFGDYYQKFFGGGTWVDLRSLVGLPLAFIFFLTLLFTAFGSSKKYWWIVIGLIPAFWFEISFDLLHLYIPILLASSGLVLGLGIIKLIPRKTPGGGVQ